MANKTIGQLTAKTTPASADVFALEDTEDTKKINYDALADAILNKITSKNYTVAGSSQTLINAINTLNSKTETLDIIASDMTDLSNKITAAINALESHREKALSLMVSGGSGEIVRVGTFYEGMIGKNSNNYGVCLLYHHSGEWVFGNLNEGTMTWQKQPTRQEITDLNSKYATKTITQSFTMPQVGWNAFSFSDYTLSGYTPIGVISYFIAAGAPYITSAYAYIQGEIPKAMINSNYSDASVSLTAIVFYVKA